AARDAGVNLAFFGANAVFAQVRYEPSAAGVPYRVMVCYKDAINDPVQGPTTTVQFRKTPVNRTEQSLPGVQFTEQTQNNGFVSYVVANNENWVYEGTGFTEGDSVSGILGYEADDQFPNAALPEYRPGTYKLLSQSPFIDYDGQSKWANSSI